MCSKFQWWYNIEDRVIDVGYAICAAGYLFCIVTILWEAMTGEPAPWDPFTSRR